MIGGNVSLYNASSGTDIDPTPVVAVLGVIDSLVRRPPGMALTPASTLVLLGATDPSLAGSRWAVECHGHRGGALPALDLAAHARLLALLELSYRSKVCSPRFTTSRAAGSHWRWPRARVRAGVGCSVDGVSVRPSCSRSRRPGSCSVRRTPTKFWPAGAAGVPARLLGTAGGDRIVVAGLLDLAVADAAEAWRVALPGALGEPVTA